MNLSEIEAAQSRIAAHVHLTSVVTCTAISRLAGAELFFKCENFQKCGSFKVRGALNALARLSDEALSAGVLTFSSGNFAQALAYAGSLKGCPVTVVMPADAPPVKIEATKQYGANVVLYDRDETTREALGNEIAESKGLTIVPPYDHRDIIAGQGTTALEFCRQVPGLDSMVVPCGGGGLLAGSAVAAKSLGVVEVVGAEPAEADDAARSHASGKIVQVENPVTIADGARTPSVGTTNFPLLLEHVDRFITLTEPEIVHAAMLIMERAKLVVEPTGALGLAAVLRDSASFSGKRVGVVLSGGNIDLASFFAQTR